MGHIIDKRLGETRPNYQNCLMKIVKYNKAIDIIVEFQDEYKAKVHTNYKAFIDGGVKNPYFPVTCGVGIIGSKYSSRENGRQTKEYTAWQDMLKRCFDEKTKGIRPTYQNVTCCNEWLLYENFYEWLHSQKNFDKWLNGSRWALDKDIINKGNKIYSPETCCLVPHNVNQLFVKSNSIRGILPIGITMNNGKFMAQCNNPFTKEKSINLGIYRTVEQAFQAYKTYKENIIKQMAKIEFNKGNITRKCYEAMMSYEVEIDD